MTFHLSARETSEVRILMLRSAGPDEIDSDNLQMVPERPEIGQLASLITTQIDSIDEGIKRRVSLADASLPEPPTGRNKLSKDGIEVLKCQRIALQFRLELLSAEAV